MLRLSQYSIISALITNPFQKMTSDTKTEKQGVFRKCLNKNAGHARRFILRAPRLGGIYRMVRELILFVEVIHQLPSAQVLPIATASAL